MHPTPAGSSPENEPADFLRRPVIRCIGNRRKHWLEGLSYRSMIQVDLFFFLFALGVSILFNVYLASALWRAHKSKPFTGSSECPKCGYDVRASIGGKCPECGEPARHRRPPPGVITRCSFCGRSSVETGVHVEGPGGVYICAPCVELCHSVILKNREKPNTDRVSGTVKP